MRHSYWNDNTAGYSFRIPFTKLYLYLSFTGCDSYGGKGFSGQLIHGGRTRGIEIGWQWDIHPGFHRTYTSMREE